MLNKELSSYISQKIHGISSYFSDELECKVNPENIKKQLKKVYNTDEYAYEQVKHKKISYSVICKDGDFVIKSTSFGDSDIEAISEAFRLLTKQLDDLMNENTTDSQRNNQISNVYHDALLKH